MVDEQDTINVGAATREATSEANKFKKDLNEKKADWKSKLSAAFNSEQIFFSLFVLSLFYAVYTIGNGYIHIKDAKNEDDVIDRCYCRSSHQAFYCTWFAICCLIWLLLHSYTYVAIRFPACGNCLKFLNLFKPKNAWKCFKKSFNYCINRKKDKDSRDSSECDNRTIQHFIEILWFQYYKLFVVGYPKHDEKIIFKSDSNRKSANKEHESKKKENTKDTCCYCITYDVEVNEDCTCGCDQNFGIFVNSFRCFNHSFLLAVKFLAQLCTIPLLFLQVFDTYSLLCFYPQWFCSDTTEYDLHLAQAVITLLFYCCLAMSQLASTMLTWNPWPKKDSERDRATETKDT